MCLLSDIFGFINYGKRVAYARVRALNLVTLLTSLVIMALVPTGVKLGRLLFDKISQKIIYRYLPIT